MDPITEVYILTFFKKLEDMIEIVKKEKISVHKNL